MFELNIGNRFFCFTYLMMALVLLSPQVMSQDEENESDPALEAIKALEAGAEETQAVESDQDQIQTEPEQVIQVEILTEPIDVSPGLSVAKDVILVLDNSGSMKKNDPQFLTNRAVTEFINSLDEETRVAIVIFDQEAHLAVRLTQVLPDTRATILQSLEQINYKGLYTDSPAAMEVAIYILKTEGREDAKKFIIFMTDGIVDTGDTNRDLEKEKWLKEDLAADAGDAGINIFGIAFTDKADFQLIQSLAQKTDGEYYRALQPEDLQNVFENIHTIINKPPEPEVTEPVITPQEIFVPPAPVIIEVPVQQTQEMDEEERMRSMMILIALSVLIIAVIVMVLMLIKGARKKGVEEEYAQEAYLNDINGYTAKNSYKLGNKPTMLGRVAGSDTDHLNYIVIPESTIGRRHTLIEYKDFAYWIIDQASINGTFVNDQPVNSETRLKHGDKVRLHKFEFEFAMPDMDDAGMTVISKTVIANQPVVSKSEEATVARVHADAQSSDMDMPEPEFDLDITGAPETDDDEDETELREHSKDSVDDDEDETIMLDDDTDTSQNGDAYSTIRRDDSDEDITEK
jgi:Mg-chelatase subunit ChlD/pSer/pThr/pTyr-binding forkhead associated (FHA) protein